MKKWNNKATYEKCTHLSTNPDYMCLDIIYAKFQYQIPSNLPEILYIDSKLHSGNDTYTTVSLDHFLVQMGGDVWNVKKQHDIIPGLLHYYTYFDSNDKEINTVGHIVYFVLHDICYCTKACFSSRPVSYYDVTRNNMLTKEFALYYCYVYNATEVLASFIHQDIISIFVIYLDFSVLEDRTVSFRDMSSCAIKIQKK